MKLVATVIAVAAILGLMAFTNPTKDQFSEYVRQAVIEKSRGEDPTGQMFGSMFGGIAGTIVAAQTVRSDYVFMSTFEVPFGNERFLALGLFNNFILLEKPKSFEKENKKKH